MDCKYCNSQLRLRNTFLQKVFLQALAYAPFSRIRSVTVSVTH